MQTSIRNNTPNSLELTGADLERLVLAPFELRKLEEKEISAFGLSAASRDGFISTWPEPPSESFEKLMAIAIWIGMGVGILCPVVAGTDTPAWFASRERWHLTVWIVGGSVFVLSMAGWP
jgi:hypothetical protein